MNRTPLDSLMQDEEILNEIFVTLESPGQFPTTEMVDRGTRSIAGGAFNKRAIVEFMNAPIGAVEGVHTSHEAAFTEAIVLAFGRPSLLVMENQFADPDSNVWHERLAPHRTKINGRLPSVGRVELIHHPRAEWVGTAWVIDERTLVTNRHVANVFAERSGNGFPFQRGLNGETIRAFVDFREEYTRPGDRKEELEIEVESVTYIAPDGSGEPDMAVLRVASHNRLPEPIDLVARDAEPGQMIGVIGYPAFDSRNSGPDMARIFANIFDVKRFSPGYVMSAERDVLLHDCTSLGGNSGSVVLDLETGKAVGLHFAGRPNRANSAVPADVVRRTLVRGSVPVGTDISDEAPPLSHYDNCEGFREDFLGRREELHVPLPRLSAELRADAAPVLGRGNSRGTSRFVLDYTHFSIVMSKSRRLAMFAAVNIDGSETVRLRRRRTRWTIDPRISREHQFDNDLYFRNKLDRGHLVRRLDPVWGDGDVPRRADNDTFHYTNAAPQHERLNQRNWLRLEEYLLDAIDGEDFRASVFTGPVFATCDPHYREGQIPIEFWKVAVMVGLDRRLHATGYLLSQAEFMDDLEFVFGRFRTFQVPISRVERKTGLDFGPLREADPLAGIEGPEAARIVEGPTDIVI